MSFDAFIKIDNIEGESADEKHQGWIEVIRYGMSLKQTVSRTASSVGGATAERAAFEDFNFIKELDKATAKLALACADGTHIDNIVIEVCRAGTDKLKFMEYKLTNCILSKIATKSGGAFPYEKVSINYGKIEWVYTLQKRAGGSAAGNVAAGWDLQRNCKA